jgi:hypothetical protein
MLRLTAMLLGGITILSVAPANCQVRPPVAGQPYQYWEVTEPDGAARKVYFRNDLTTPITIAEVSIQRCENTRQVCGTYPSNLVVDPGKTVMAFKVERLDKKLGWSYSYAFRTSIVKRVEGPPPAAVMQGMLPPGAIVMQDVAVDLLISVVPAITENSSCGMVTMPSLPEGHKALVMVFGPASHPTARTVMVKVDGNNAPYDYQDMRREPVDNVAEPYFSIITIDLIRQTATLQNSGHGEQPAFLHATGAAVKNAASLGNPMEMVAKIVKECGK